MSKKHLSVYFLIILLGGLLWSRALLSMTILFWALMAIYQAIKFDRSIFKRTIFLWSVCPLFIWGLGAWQDPAGSFNYDYLLTLIAYPAAVLIVQTSPKSIVSNQWIRIWLSATIIALAYPIIWYFKNTIEAQSAYGKGQSLPTFMDTDHVRFSIFLCSSLLFLFFSELVNKKLRYPFCIILFLLILFLSVRTGWVLGIIIVIMYALSTFFKTKEKKIRHSLIGLSFFFVFIASAYFIFPTIQQKLAYSNWEWEQYQPTVYNASYSDGVRRNINFAAWQIIQNNYGVNTGWQGISTTLQTSFSALFKGQSIEFGWPFNQWLFWWMGSGWWGMILFSIWLFYPAWKGWQQKNWGIISWTIAIAFSCLVETTLNYQYGVFLHVFPIAMLWENAVISKSDNL